MELTAGGWITLALVNAGLAEQKNRSRATWFVLSLLIGPLATAMIVIWPAAEAAGPSVRLTPGMLLACAIVLAAAAVAAAVFALISSDWVLWVACGVAALGAVAFAARRAWADAVPTDPRR